MQPLISPEAVQEIIRLYTQEGLSVEEIRQKTGRSIIRILFTLEEKGFHPREDNRMKAINMGL